MFQLSSSVGLQLASLCLWQASHPAGVSNDTYLFDDDVLCDEFDFLNNLTDSDEQLSPEGAQYVSYGHCYIVYFFIRLIVIIKIHAFVMHAHSVVIPLPPLGHIWDVMLVWRKGNINTKCLCVTVLCTVIMVHKDTSSSYRSVDCIGLWSCLV